MPSIIPFPLKKICNKIPFDKTSINKIQNRSADFTQALRYSSYVNNNRRIFKTIIEGQVINITMINATPNTATITFSYVSNPTYIMMIATNIQDITDTHQFNVYNSPYTFTNLKPNSYYTINTYTVYVSGNRYLKIFSNAVLTLNQGPVLEPIYITNPEYNSATLNFVSSIGNPTLFNLTVINVDNKYQTNYYPDIRSPFLITGLEPNIKYDISLSSYYSNNQKTYFVYKSGINGFFFKTYNENYPVFIETLNITNISVIIHFSFTGYPSYNLITLINDIDPNDRYDITDTEYNTQIIISSLRINSTYNLTITSYYPETMHTYITTEQSIFRTLFESSVSNIQILSLFGNAVTISLSQAEGEVYSYVIYLSEPISGQLFEKSYNTYPGYVTFSNLILNTDYILTIQSRYITNIYTSDPIPVKTLNEGSITNIYYDNIENSSARIYYIPSPGNNPTYLIRYNGIVNNTTTYNLTPSLASETSYNMTELIANTPYSITVDTYYATNSDITPYRVYSYRNASVFTTLNQNETTIVSIDIGSNYIDVTIINTFGFPNRFSIITTKTNDNEDFTTTIYEKLANTKATIRVDSLLAFTSYNISINTNYYTINDDISRNYVTIYPTPIITLRS